MKIRILANAEFVTDSDRHSTAVAVVGDTIAAVGELRDVRRSISADEEIDLEGATVFPGFADSHVHVLNFGRSRMGVPCWPVDVDSVTEIVEKVRDAHLSTPTDKWIRGRGYDPSRLAERRAPHAAELDIDGHRCVMLDSFDFHRRVVNNAGLKAAGIGPETPNPPDGEIIKDADGHPTGELVDGARALIDKVIPPWSDEEDEQAIQIASTHFLSLGFTYVTNAAPLTMSAPGEEIAAFVRLRQKDELRLRFISMFRAELLQDVWRLGLLPGFGDTEFRIGGAKVFADGALGTRTAFLSEPYADSERVGSMRIDQDDLASIVREGAAAGWQMCVHTQGDRAIEIVSKLLADNPTSAGHRIEHCCLTSPEAIASMAGGGITPVPQIGFLRYRSPDFVAALGEERVAKLYPLRSWIDAGLKPIHSSDAPVIADARPLAAAATAMSRKDDRGDQWGTDEAVTFEEFASMLTAWPAQAAGLASERGRIAPGLLADFTVFRDDPRSFPPEELSDIAPSMTIVGGDVAWAP